MELGWESFENWTIGNKKSFTSVEVKDFRKELTVLLVVAVQETAQPTED